MLFLIQCICLWQKFSFTKKYPLYGIHLSVYIYIYLSRPANSLILWNIVTQLTETLWVGGRLILCSSHRENSSQSCRGDLGNTNLKGIMDISCQPDRVFRHYRSAEPELLWTVSLLLAELKEPQRQRIAMCCSQIWAPDYLCMYREKKKMGSHVHHHGHSGYYRWYWGLTGTEDHHWETKLRLSIELQELYSTLRRLSSGRVRRFCSSSGIQCCFSMAIRVLV